MKKTVLGLFLFSILTAASFAGISFKLNGGMSYVSVQDWNTGVDGWNAWINSFTNPSGGLENLHWAADLGGEVIFSFNKRVAVGIGGGYFQLAKTNRFSYYETEGSVTYFYRDHTWTPKISVVPLLLNFHYTAPLGRSLRLMATVGGGYYLGTFHLTNEYHIIAYYISTNNDGVETFNASKGTFGAQGGIGLEIALSKKLFVCLDVGGQFAKLTDLEGTRRDAGVTTGYYTGSYDTSADGWTIWYVERTVDGVTYKLVEVDINQPSGSDVTNVRRAAIDLSGFKAAIGIRLAL